MYEEENLCSIWENSIYGRLKPERERRFIINCNMGETKTTIGISWHQSLLRKTPAAVSWEECIRHLPLRTFSRSKKTVELCAMD